MNAKTILGLTGIGIAVLVGCGGSGGDDTQSGNGALSAPGSDSKTPPAPASGASSATPPAAPASTPADDSALWDAMLKAFDAENIRAFRDISIDDGFPADDVPTYMSRATKALSVADKEFNPPLAFDVHLAQLWDLGAEDQPGPEVLALRGLLDGRHIDRKIVIVMADRENLPAAIAFATSTTLVGMCMVTTNTNETEACRAVGKDLPPDPPPGPPGEDAQ
jgi:hypothetical protein